MVDNQTSDLCNVHRHARDVRIRLGYVVLCRLDEPRDTGEAENGPIHDGLVAKHPAGEVVKLTFDELLRPEENWGSGNVRVAARRCVGNVGNGVVMIVLVLPPVDGEALEDIAHHDAEDVVDTALHKYLVVKEVVSQPAALLPKQSHKKGGDEDDRPKAGKHDKCNGEGANCQIAEDLEGIVQLARVKQAQCPNLLSHLNNILDILAIDAGKRRVARVFQNADGECWEESPRIRRSMEAGEDICSVKPRGGEDDVAPRVALCKVGDVIHAALDGDPGVVGGVVRG